MQTMYMPKSNHYEDIATFNGFMVIIVVFLYRMNSSFQDATMWFESQISRLLIQGTG